MPVRGTIATDATTLRSLNDGEQQVPSRSTTWLEYADIVVEVRSAHIEDAELRFIESLTETTEDHWRTRYQPQRATGPR